MPFLKPFFLLLAAWVLSAAQLYSETPGSATATKVRAYVEQNDVAILKQLADFLAFENVSQNTPKGHADVEKNANYLVSLLDKRGMHPEILTVEGGFPAVYAELITPGATKTITFYAHFDGQPVDAPRWKTPPFTPVLLSGKMEYAAAQVDLAKLTGPLPIESKDWRLYARSASDDKAAVIGFLAALDALKASGIAPSVNLKFFFEGEEEAGSQHLGSILEKYSGKLRSDLWILCDGPTHQSGRNLLVYGARGVIGLEMTFYGPNRALHSGHYGNWAPNPAAELANILAGMRDTDGLIRIKDFYSPVRSPTPAEQQALAAIPNTDASLRDELALGRTEGHGERLERLLMNPAMNIRGIRAGNVGAAAANAIMTEASASIDFRLVPDQTPELVQQQVENHLMSSGYEIVHGPVGEDARKKNSKLIRLDWEGGYPASRTDLDSPVATAVANTIQSALRVPLLKLPTLGGSVPMYLFKEKLNVPAVILPIANYDNNQHSSNENIRLSNLRQGIEIYAQLMAELGKN